MIQTKYNCDGECGDQNCEALIIDHLFEDLYPDGAFDYDVFMDAYDQVDWSQIPYIKLIPERAEFDFCSAVEKRRAWFERYAPETIHDVVVACKKVNRWNFVKVCI